MSILKKIIPDPLILYLFIAIIFAYLYPQLSYIKYNFINLDLIIDIGVMLVFFFYGVKLQWKEVFKDLLNWRLHLTIQSITFILFPLIGLLFYPLITIDDTYYLLFIALFYLCCLPSTVSSSVVMVSLAKGNVTSAIFNASLSGLIGILLTPLWLSLFIKQSESIESSSIIINLLISVVLPVFIGALCQPIIGKYYELYKNWLVNIDKITIVLIVYNSFSHTFLDGLLTKIGISRLLLMSILVLILFLSVFYLIKICNQYFFKFKRAEFITMQFCGTKKSLVHGSVMGSIIFQNEMGMILLPIMIYHTLQLIFISYKATQYAKEVD